MAVDAARAKSLFLNASDLADPAERAAYLDRECGGDAELRQRVEALLAADDGGGRSVEGDAGGTSGPTSPATHGSDRGRRCGNASGVGACDRQQRSDGADSTVAGARGPTVPADSSRAR